MSKGASGTGGGSIRTYPLPPDGFDPRAASPLELRRYGLPQRPDPAVRPELAALWDEVFSRKLSYITPTFVPMEELVPGLRRAARPRPDVTATDEHWSGAVTHASTGETFDWVAGQWNVPYVEPVGQGSGPWVIYTWIGIDGMTDVTQIGTMEWVSTDLTTGCVAFYEWWSASTNAYPSLPQTISNFPVSFGDTIYGLICMQSPTAADFSMINMTTGVHVLFGHTPLPAPPNTTSMENQAEWINERPGDNLLPDFSPISFNSAYAGHGLDFVVEGGTADTLVNMVDNGTTVATTTLEPPTSIEIVYTGGPPRVLAGQLLAYADDGTPGNVSDPVAVGFGGWLDFKFLFAGANASGENRIYAVDHNGRLLSYGDDGTPGNVSDPVTVGFGGWLDFKVLLAAENLLPAGNRIYAVPA